MTKKEFVSHYIKKHSESNAKIFPDDFTDVAVTKKYELPPNTLVIGCEFFGRYEILTTEGSPVTNAENIYKAKYIVYANRSRKGTIMIPDDEIIIKSAVEKYEEYLDWILLDIVNNIKIYIPESPDINIISNEIFMKLNLVRY